MTMPDRREFLGAVAGVASAAIMPVPAVLIGSSEPGIPLWKNYAFTYPASLSREEFIRRVREIVDGGTIHVLPREESVDKTG
jgi:hypothetical protein